MGLHKKIETPERLWFLFLEFKTWLKQTPLYKNEFNAKVGDIVSIPLERPLTWSRFDCYVNDLGILTDLEDYRTNRDDRYSDFGGVVTRINREMHADKFEGASVGIFNSNIIARDLGLVDKKETEHSGEIKSAPLTPEIAKAISKRLDENI
jgi:hypothetical protein